MCLFIIKRSGLWELLQKKKKDNNLAGKSVGCTKKFFR